MTSEPDDIERIPLGSLKRYLATAGWRRNALRSGLELYSLGPAADEIEIVLPGTSQARDVFVRIGQAVHTLTALEGRDTVAVIAAIRAISYDLIKSRLPDSVIRHDTIKLGTAEEFIRRMARLLAASAHAELHASAYFTRVDGVAQRYADECRFGHTFRGSFGFTVESPVGPNTIVPGEAAPPAPPLERRTVQRLARGLRLIEGAIAREDPGEIVRGYEAGLNANACEELAALVEVPHAGEVRIDIAFSPEWGVPDVGAAPSFEIRHALSAEIMREAAKALRHSDEERRRTIVGKIRTLHSNENPSDLFSISGTQDVIVEWDSDEHGLIRVRVSLPPEEYLQAVDAHKTGRMVSIHGELKPPGRFWRLENPRDFTLL
ncbi:hypothetical protein FV226_13150 [Methylobacterium sp. WL12]|uniref:hypothetical protein n=1 Tax=Methylobacterium sp. WL12 TaxID=2603890 RepID=UPI0011C7558C|nr:hypothetical protein [Methylobacterium sp. WL12]TXM72170.1 hypothetical protein FV226_13150 [Methylobacterium sp. WL12]